MIAHECGHQILARHPRIAKRVVGLSEASEEILASLLGAMMCKCEPTADRSAKKSGEPTADRSLKRPWEPSLAAGQLSAPDALVVIGGALDGYCSAGTLGRPGHETAGKPGVSQRCPDPPRRSSRPWPKQVETAGAPPLAVRTDTKRNDPLSVQRGERERSAVGKN
jgi:hypothetical protein